MTIRLERLDSTDFFVANPAAVAAVFDSGQNPGSSVVRLAVGGPGIFVKGKAREVMAKLGMSLGDYAAPDFPDELPYEGEPRALEYHSGEE